MQTICQLTLQLFIQHFKDTNKVVKAK